MFNFESSRLAIEKRANKMLSVACCQ